MIFCIDIGIGTYTLILVLAVIVPVQYDEWGNRLSRTLLNTQHLLDTGVGYLLPIVIVFMAPGFMINNPVPGLLVSTL